MEEYFEICIKSGDLQEYLAGKKVDFRFAKQPKEDEVKILVKEEKLNYLLGRNQNPSKTLLKG